MSATDFLDYVNTTGSPFHATRSVVQMLEDVGFERLDERNPTIFQNIKKGGKYYLTRNGSSVVAFIVGGNFNPAQNGMVIAVGHSDSPALRVRPRSSITSEECQLVGVETYGGGLWHTWFDRGLGMAGKAVIRKSGHLEEHLVRINNPILIIPNLAIHLQSPEDRAAFKINTENHLRPILSTVETANKQEGHTETDNPASAVNLTVQSVLAEQLGCDPVDVIDWDMYLMDTVPSRLAGRYKEFVDSPRIDNLSSTWAIFESLKNVSASANTLEDIVVGATFDNEEVGSLSFTGAFSSILENWLRRLAHAVTKDCSEDVFNSMMARSYLMSLDASHAVHPNYSEKYQAQHKPVINKGPVVKENSSQKYCSHALSMAIIREVARTVGIPMQDLVVRNDSPCGTTIGPMTTARLGIRGVDVGIPQLAMHSIREMCGAEDLASLCILINAVFTNFRQVDNALQRI